MNTYEKILKDFVFIDDDIIAYVRKIVTVIRENKDPSIWIPKLPVAFWTPIRTVYALIRSLPPVDNADGFPAAHDWVRQGDLKSVAANVFLAAMTAGFLLFVLNLLA